MSQPSRHKGAAHSYTCTTLTTSTPRMAAFAATSPGVTDALTSRRAAPSLVGRSSARYHRLTTSATNTGHYQKRRRASRPIHSRCVRSVGFTPARCASTQEVASADAADNQSRVKAAQDAVRRAAVEVRPSTASGEIRAAAAARALSFYTYPADRSEFSVRAHRNMRIDAEWDAIGAKIDGKDEAFRDCRVACIVAAMRLGPDGELPEGFDASTLDPACMVPSRSATEPGMIILGTLDVNQGRGGWGVVDTKVDELG